MIAVTVGAWTLSLPRVSIPPLGAWLIGIAGILPVVTWVNLGSANAVYAATETPKLLFVMVVCVALGVAIVRGVATIPADPWLGACVIYAAVCAVWTHIPGTFGHPSGIQVALLIACAAVWMSLVRSTPIAWRPRALLVLVGFGVLHVPYAILQAWNIDPLWPQKQPGLVHGFAGNPNWAGALLAVLVAAAPVVCVPVLLLGILLTKSSLGMGAAVVGLIVARGRRIAWWKLVAGALVLLTLSYTMRTHRHLLPWLSRLDVWTLGLVDWLYSPPWVWIFGRGPGSWVTRIPELQLMPGVYAHYPNFRGEVFGAAHNEYVQLVYEHGLIGVGLVAGWAWSHRRALWRATPLTGAVAALAVDSIGMFPLRITHVAIPALTLVALALEDPCTN